MTTGTILVVEDEASIRRIIQTYLENAGFTVYCVHNGPDALSHFRQNPADLVILDLNLPGMDGLEVAAQLHQSSDVYLLMLTARSAEEDRVAGLRLGADDYLTKPFSPREMVARVQAILRRRRGSPPRSTAQTFAHVTIDEEKYEAYANGRLLELTATEFQVLRQLAHHAGRVLTRDQLIERVWGAEFYGNDRVVDVYVGQVRRKLQEATNLTLIETVRGVGYKFIDEK